MEEQLRARLRATTRQYQTQVGACHRYDHTERVVRMALQLAQCYPQIDCDALESAAWLHDIGRGVEREQGISHADASVSLARPLLSTLGFSADRIALILAAICDHRYSTGRVPSSLEGKLLQDADRLDALGAIGIARTFAEGGERMLYHPAAPFVDGRPLDDTQYTLDHFYSKLLSLPNTMHTPEARQIATRRCSFLQAFLHELAVELGSTHE